MSRYEYDASRNEDGSDPHPLSRADIGRASGFSAAGLSPNSESKASLLFADVADTGVVALIGAWTGVDEVKTPLDAAR